MAETLYDVLGVAADASPQALRDAHRQRARQLHPDTASGDAEAMRALNGAWAVLSDPARRAAYDRTLATPARRQPQAKGHDEDDADDDLHTGPGPGKGRGGPVERPTIRMRLWPFLVLGAGLLVVVTAYAGSPGDTRTSAEPVGQCLVEGGALDRIEPCRSAGGLRLVAMGGPGVQCPAGSDVRVLRGDPEGRRACVGRVAGR